LDGTATVLMYELKEIPVQENMVNEFITREEFEKTIAELMNRVAIPTSVETPAEPKPQYKF
jgi:hypothetical protein